MASTTTGVPSSRTPASSCPRMLRLPKRMYARSEAQMLVDRICSTSPLPGGSARSTSATHLSALRTAFIAPSGCPVPAHAPAWSQLRIEYHMHLAREPFSHMVIAMAKWHEERLLIDGKLVPAAGGATYETINPATEAVLGRSADASLADAQRAIAAARRAFDTTEWSRERDLRVRCLRQLRTALLDNADSLREILVQ